MSIPDFLLKHFPPSSSKLFDYARRRMDNFMLRDVARADYGIGADEVYEELRIIRDRGTFPAKLSFQLTEVLELTSYSNPDIPNRPCFEPGPVGQRGHHTRLFACAVLLHLTADPTTPYEVLSPDFVLAQSLGSVTVLDDEYKKALGTWLTWWYPSAHCRELVALALLVLTIQLKPRNVTEESLHAMTDWILLEEQAFCKELYSYIPFNYNNPYPGYFSINHSAWHAAAQTIQAFAATVKDPALQENLLLCTLMLSK